MEMYTYIHDSRSVPVRNSTSLCASDSPNITQEPVSMAAWNANLLYDNASIYQCIALSWAVCMWQDSAWGFHFIGFPFPHSHGSAGCQIPMTLRATIESNNRYFSKNVMSV